MPNMPKILCHKNRASSGVNGIFVSLNDDLRELIRNHKAELLQALAAEPEAYPRGEARRQRVLAMLEASPGARYAVVTDTAAGPAAVIVALAIRGQAT